MRLVLFQSLAKGCISKQLTSVVSRHFDGFEISLLQLNTSVLNACADSNHRLICRIDPESEADAGRQLHSLSNKLDSAGNASHSLDMVVMSVPPPQARDLAKAGEYLYRVLPRAAQFLEHFPFVGKSHGILNAHGRPLSNHVLGVCQSIPACPDMLSDIVDLLPPTNLSLSDNFGKVCMDANEETLISLLQHTEHIYIRGEENLPQSIITRLWDLKCQAGASETYATISGDSASRLAAELRKRFQSASNMT